MHKPPQSKGGEPNKMVEIVSVGKQENYLAFNLTNCFKIPNDPT